jgi:hypothetical protein
MYVDYIGRIIKFISRTFYIVDIMSTSSYIHLVLENIELYLFNFAFRVLH